eukprot:SAG11_NODE_13895_length_634_cov_1.257944_2_plen_32_part_01
MAMVMRLMALRSLGSLGRSVADEARAPQCVGR